MNPHPQLDHMPSNAFPAPELNGELHHLEMDGKSGPSWEKKKKMDGTNHPCHSQLCSWIIIHGNILIFLPPKINIVDWDFSSFCLKTKPGTGVKQSWCFKLPLRDVSHWALNSL